MLKTEKKIKRAITKKGYRINKGDLTKSELNKLKNKLTVAPHEGTDDEGEKYPIYLLTDKYIYIPKYLGIKLYGEPDKLVHQKKTKNKMRFTKTLRQKQIPIADKCIKYLKKNGGGLLSLPCGFGKTILSLYIACKLRVKTLVIVHKTFLQEQWIERIKEFTNAKIGIIRQNKVDVEGKDIIIGMLQSISLRDYDKEIFKDISLVIIDEAHHIAARVFCRAFNKICSKYTLGLSATPNRKDGLTKLLYWNIGEMIHKEERAPNKKVCVRTFNYTSSNPLFREKRRWIKGKVRPDTNKMTTNIWNINERNVFLLKILNILRNVRMRKILFLSHRIDHLRLLKAAIDKIISKDVLAGRLEQNECVTDYYKGKMKKDALKKAEEADILFGSVAMAEEGLDIPELNTIILATPKKEIEQAVGRILRKSVADMTITPLIIDIRDNLSVFDGWGSKRNSYYRRNRYNLKTYETFNTGLIQDGERDSSSDSDSDSDDACGSDNNSDNNKCSNEETKKERYIVKNMDLPDDLIYIIIDYAKTPDALLIRVLKLEDVDIDELDDMCEFNDVGADANITITDKPRTKVNFQNYMFG